MSDEATTPGIGPAAVLREPKVDYRDVLPAADPSPLDTPPEPTLVELIADDLKADGRRSTDISEMLRR